MGAENASRPERLYELLLRLGRLVQSQERLGAAPLLPVQLNALHYLARANRYSNTPLAVAEYLGVTKGTASQTVRALEQRALVDRSTDPDDRRVQRLNVTAAGRRLLDEALPPLALTAAVSGLEARADRLCDDLTELLRGVQRAAGGRAFGICRTCRHFRPARGRAGLCGLTGETLASAEGDLICREHLAS